MYLCMDESCLDIVLYNTIISASVRIYSSTQMRQGCVFSAMHVSLAKTLGYVIPVTHWLSVNS